MCFVLCQLRCGTVDESRTRVKSSPQCVISDSATGSFDRRGAPCRGRGQHARRLGRSRSRAERRSSRRGEKVLELARASVSISSSSRPSQLSHRSSITGMRSRGGLRRRYIGRSSAGRPGDVSWELSRGSLGKLHERQPSRAVEHHPGPPSLGKDQYDRFRKIRSCSSAARAGRLAQQFCCLRGGQ